MEIDWPRSRWNRTFLIAMVILLVGVLAVTVGLAVHGLIVHVGFLRLGLIIGGVGLYVFICWIIAGIVEWE